MLEHIVYSARPVVAHTEASGLPRHPFGEDHLFGLHIDKGYPYSGFNIELAETLYYEHQADAAHSLVIVRSHYRPYVFGLHMKVVFRFG